MHQPNQVDSLSGINGRQVDKWENSSVKLTYLIDVKAIASGIQSVTMKD